MRGYPLRAPARVAGGRPAIAVFMGVERGVVTEW
jgi:hypothetical protein